MKIKKFPGKKPNCENFSKIEGKSETWGKMHHGLRGDGRPCVAPRREKTNSGPFLSRPILHVCQTCNADEFQRHRPALIAYYETCLRSFTQALVISRLDCSTLSYYRRYNLCPQSCMQGCSSNKRSCSQRSSQHCSNYTGFPSAYFEPLPRTCNPWSRHAHFSTLKDFDLPCI